jgi:hypothetical protein
MFHTRQNILIFRRGLAACFMLISCLTYSLALKLEATFFSETSVDFQWTTPVVIKLWGATPRGGGAQHIFLQIKIKNSLNKLEK